MCQRTVEEADVVECQDRGGAGSFQVVQPFDLEPEESSEQDRDEVAERVGRELGSP